VKDDLRIAFRSLARQPAFAALAIAPLAIGIGFTTAVFSIANALLIRPLPFPAGDRLMLIQSTQSDGRGTAEFQVSAPDLDDWARESRSFSSMGASMPFAFNLTGAGRPQRVSGGRATATLFSTLEIRPSAGRFFSAAEERDDAPVAVLSREFWATQFAASPAAIGRTVALDGRAYVIVGVLPGGFRFGPKADLLVPFRERPSDARRNVRGFNVVARLRTGVSRDAAERELAGIAAVLAREHPDTSKGWGVSVRPLRDVIVDGVRSAVWVLFAASGFLLLVACVNVSNLLLVRASGRRGEVAIRAALGGRRSDILRGFLAESLLLGAAGGSLGVALAWGGLKPLLAACPVELAAVGPVGVDLRVLGFTMAVSLAASVLAGSAAGWEGSRADLSRVLNDSGRTTAGSRTVRRFQAALVAFEIAVVLLLAVGSGVAFVAFQRLRRVRAGFDPKGAVAMTIAVPEARYSELSQRAALVRRLTDGLSTLPGVTAVGATNKLPLDENTTVTSFLVEGGAAAPDGNGWTTQFRRVTPGYLGAMKIELAEGRGFSEDDVDGKPLVAVVSRAFARRYWPGRSAVGMRIQRMTAIRAWTTVVGVAGDVRDVGLAADPPPTLYVPYAQGKAALPDVHLVVRSDAAPESLVRPVAGRVAAIDPDLPAGAVVALSTIVSDSLRRQRFQMVLMGLLAAAGIALAGVGIFGLISYTVSQRSRDLAIRLALGATASDVRGFITAHGARLAAFGVAAGLAAVAAGGRLLRGILPGMPAPEPALVGAVATGFGGLCIVASWLAARRAAAIAQAEALGRGGVA